MKVGFIVEGFHDEDKMKEVLPDCLCVTMKRTCSYRRIKMDLLVLMEQCEQVFVLTDPDGEGDRLAQMVLNDFPDLVRIHIDPEEAKCIRHHKLKIGVEHCTNEYLLSVLKEHLPL